jgi:hypothetical protein
MIFFYFLFCSFLFGVQNIASGDGAGSVGMSLFDNSITVALKGLVHCHIMRLHGHVSVGRDQQRTWCFYFS